MEDEEGKKVKVEVVQGGGVFFLFLSLFAISGNPPAVGAGFFYSSVEKGERALETPKEHKDKAEKRIEAINMRPIANSDEPQEFFAASGRNRGNLKNFCSSLACGG